MRQSPTTLTPLFTSLGQQYDLSLISRIMDGMGLEKTDECHIGSVVPGKHLLKHENATNEVTESGQCTRVCVCQGINSNHAQTARFNIPTSYHCYKP